MKWGKIHGKGVRIHLCKSLPGLFDFDEVEIFSFGSLAQSMRTHVMTIARHPYCNSSACHSRACALSKPYTQDHCEVLTVLTAEGFLIEMDLRHIVSREGPG